MNLNKTKTIKITAFFLFGLIIFSSVYSINGAVMSKNLTEDNANEQELDTEVPMYDDTPIIDTGVEPIDFTGEEVVEPDNYDRNAIEWSPIEESLKSIQIDAEAAVTGVSIATASYDAVTGVESIINPQFLPSPESMPELSVVEPYAGLLAGTETAESVIGGDGRYIFNNQVFPGRTIVKLYISASDGSNWVGSGAIVDDFHVLTAGHCAFLPDNGGWASSIEIVPGMDTSDNPSDPYGHAWTVGMRSYTGWTVDESSQHDWALLTLDRNVGAYTGWMGRKMAGYTSSIYTGIMYVAGYPTDLDGGNRLYADSDWGAGATFNNHYYWADTAAGMSGGPVWDDDAGYLYIMTVHAYGRGGVLSNFGTRLNADKYNRLYDWLHEDPAPTDKADLIDRGSSYDSMTTGTWQAGVTSVTITNGIRNVGTATSGNYYVHYYASTNDYISTYDYYIGTSTLESTTAFGTDSATFTGQLPSDIPAGVYYIGWIIDQADNVDEFDEGNNVAVYAYQRTIDGAPPPSGYIEVTARDSSTYNLIPSAYVSVKDDTDIIIDTGYTDSSGFYNVTGLDIGWYTVDVSKVGYHGQYKLNYINWDGDDDYLTFYMVAKPPDSGYIEVNVKDYDTSNPISSAYVQVTNMSSGVVIKAGYTNGAGFYNVTGLYIGWYEVTVSKVSYKDQSKQDYINWNGDDDYLYFYMKKMPIDSGYIEVRTLNESGGPLAGVLVKAWNNSGATLLSSGYSDANGFYNITGLVIGWVEVNVTYSGWQEQSKSTYIHWNGDDDYLSFWMVPNPPGSGYIEVNVRDSVSYSAIYYALVTVTNQSSGLVIQTGYTDPTGLYKVVNLTIGWYTIDVTKVGYHGQSQQDYINWAGDDDYLTFNMVEMPPDSGYIEVTAKYSDTSNPIQNAYVRCLYLNGTVFKTGYTNSAGFFNITGLYIGYYLVEVSKAGYKGGELYDYINWNGDDDYLTFYLTLMPPDSGNIEVRVYDGTTYIPVENAYVLCFNATNDVLLFSGFTDSSGFFNITGLYMGWVSVNISHPMYEFSSRLNYIDWNGDDDYLYFYLSKLQTKVTGSVAIFRDIIPWGKNATEPILRKYGIPYTVYGSSDFGSVNLSPFQKVIIASDQPQSFYDALNPQVSWLESYASNGGIIQIHAVDDGWQTADWSSSFLMPGGINKTQFYLQLNVSIRNFIHPMLLSPFPIEDAELDSWIGGSFTQYVPYANRLLIDPISNNPVLIEFPYGAGYIIASTHTLEWNQYENLSNLLENMVIYDPLTIPDFISVFEPNGTTSWQNGTTQTLTWATTGNITNVKIELYRDGVYLMDISANTTNDGEHIWNIPSTLEKSTKYQIKISNVANPAGFGYSSEFEVWTDTITLTSPDSLKIWETGTTQSITWNKTGTFDNVKILLYENDTFLMEITPSTPNDGSFDWNIPYGLLNSTLYQIKIFDPEYPNTVDLGDYFEIFEIDTLTITMPAGLIIWALGSNHTISWDSIGSVVNVSLQLFKDGVLASTISDNTPNDGSFLWEIPIGLDESALYQIKITDLLHNFTYDFSDNFELLHPSITITSPISGDSWTTGSAHTINWTSRGIIPNVKIELYASGYFIIEISASTPNDGRFDWTIPDILGNYTEYVIRISDVLDPLVYDDSAMFTITSPSGGGIPGFNILILGGILLGITSYLIIRKRKKLSIHAS